jgi:NAD(P)-dependent dehydrogenase (short-subunit alcohol dehydrogenase family)
VVVGAGGGIGSAVALGLATYGARTVCVDVDEAGIERTDALIKSAGGSSEACVANILDSGALAALIERYAAAEILVITPAILVRKRILEQSNEEFDRQMDLNVKGTFNVAQAFGREMAARGRGNIIGFSSVRASVVEPGSGVYAATKAAVRQLLRTLAAELGPQGVRVNLIAPSPVETPLTADLQSRGNAYADTAQRSMLRRWAKPQDFIGPVLLLASDAGAFMTGTELFVDGGWTASDGMDRLR